MSAAWNGDVAMVLLPRRGDGYQEGPRPSGRIGGKRLHVLPGEVHVPNCRASGEGMRLARAGVEARLA